MDRVLQRASLHLLLLRLLLLHWSVPLLVCLHQPVHLHAPLHGLPRAPDRAAWDWGSGDCLVAAAVGPCRWMSMLLVRVCASAGYAGAAALCERRDEYGSHVQWKLEAASWHPIPTKTARDCNSCKRADGQISRPINRRPRSSSKDNKRQLQRRFHRFIERGGGPVDPSKREFGGCRGKI